MSFTTGPFKSTVFQPLESFTFSLMKTRKTIVQTDHLLLPYVVGYFFYRVKLILTSEIKQCSYLCHCSYIIGNLRNKQYLLKCLGNDRSLPTLRWGESCLYKPLDFYLVINLASPEIILHTSSDLQMDDQISYCSLTLTVFP
jgi:hypothetical protein